ncbi:MAG: VWA domain-containing protein [Gammaproteobacteria bacterium]|nr:VWA domain-containing protein [Gammaproteobacteria bacterium]
MIRKIQILGLSLAALLFTACGDSGPQTRGVYMLLDTSGTYTEEMDKASNIINFLLLKLNPGDSLAVARIDSGSFSEKDIIAKVTFDTRPSVTNQQKRGFREKMDDFISGLKSSPYTDITGGLIQAVEFLTETGVGNKTILVFSDMEEDLKKGHVRDFTLDMKGCEVIALNVTKLRSDQVDPREYMKRLEHWRARIEEGGGTFRVINDLDRLQSIFGE